MPRMTEPTALSLARTIRPASYGSAGSERIQEPVIEPMWTGLRVIAAAEGGEAGLFVDGEPVTEHGKLAAALAESIGRTADALILDAFVTKQAVLTDAIIYTGTEALPSSGQLLVQSMVGSRGNRAEEAAQRLETDVRSRMFEPDDVLNLVAIDLLWLDGEWLLDIPLLERKRLLEAVLPDTNLVRAGLYVRPPIQTWIGSWRAQGFPGVTFKAANSRYQPGETNPEWTTISMPRR
jgi:hypothetical protein